jgi:hypothetical protein
MNTLKPSVHSARPVEEYSAGRHPTEWFNVLLAGQDQMLQAMNDFSPNNWPSRKVVRYAAEPLRAIYRNVFYPPTRWQFRGRRLVDDLS